MIVALEDEPLFHLEAPQNVILKVFPYFDDGSVFTPKGISSLDIYDC
jgi:hypothetical protein